MKTEGSSARSSNGGDPAPETAGAAFSDAAARLGEVREYVAYYIAAKMDAVKGTVRNVVLYAILGVLALLAGAAAVIVSVALFLIGAAHGIGAALGDRPWLGELIVSVVVLGVIVVGAWLGVSMVTKSSRKKTVEKYESRKREQLSRFGHDLRTGTGRG